MNTIHVIAIQGEVSRLRSEISHLLAAYMHLVKNNATLDERKRLRQQIKMLTSRATELQNALSEIVL